MVCARDQHTNTLLGTLFGGGAHECLVAVPPNHGCGRAQADHIDRLLLCNINGNRTNGKTRNIIYLAHIPKQCATRENRSVEINRLAKEFLGAEVIPNKRLSGVGPRLQEFYLQPHAHITSDCPCLMVQLVPRRP